MPDGEATHDLKQASDVGQEGNGAVGILDDIATLAGATRTSTMAG